MSKIKFVFFVVLFAIVSLKYGSYTKGVFAKNINSILSWYLETKLSIGNAIDEHFFQQRKIEELRSNNIRLRKSVALLTGISSRLDGLLEENRVKKYNYKAKLVRSISYINLNDYYRVWIEYNDFNKSRIYGLLSHGNSAGIVVESNGNPMALLLGDKQSIFSVFIGGNKIPGVIMGQKKEVHVKYIPLWMNPKIGDKVVTSGLDGIFFKGVRVGVVSKVVKEELSKTAIIVPYAKINVPSYYHIIEKK